MSPTAWQDLETRSNVPSIGRYLLYAFGQYAFCETQSLPPSSGTGPHRRLIIMLGARKSHHLPAEVGEPRRLTRQKNCPGLDRNAGSVEAHLFILARKDRAEARPHLEVTFLEKSNSCRGLFYQHFGCFSFVVKTQNGPFQVEVIQPVPEHGQQIPTLFPKSPNGGDRIVALRIGRHASIPTDHHRLEPAPVGTYPT
jgi:hypothetical protein